jgi:hypothetical protein
MTGTLNAERTAGTAVTPIEDVVALIASVVVLIAYAALPLRNDGNSTGLQFIDSGTTFAVLTLIVGAVGLVTSLISLAAIRERAGRWWFVGLGVLGLLFLLDNTLRQKAVLSIGGGLAMLGCVALIAQAAIPRPAATDANRANDTVLGLARVLVGTLWFTQLLWKLPWNNYGCPAGALVPAVSTSGLCDWIGREIASPRWPVYKGFLESIVSRNLSWIALLIVTGEAFVCLSLLFGILTRLGALLGAVMGLNLFIGLTTVPGEWDWTYLMLPALCAVFVVIGGRWIGVDALLYPRLKAWAGRGSIVARLLALLV